jgi:hypothetical protein
VQERDQQPLLAPPSPPEWDQRQSQRARPDLRREAPASPEIWQRGVPPVKQGPTS